MFEEITKIAMEKLINKESSKLANYVFEAINAGIETSDDIPEFGRAVVASIKATALLKATLRVLDQEGGNTALLLANKQHFVAVAPLLDEKSDHPAAKSTSTILKNINEMREGNLECQCRSCQEKKAGGHAEEIKPVSAEVHAETVNERTAREIMEEMKEATIQ